MQRISLSSAIALGLLSLTPLAFQAQDGVRPLVVETSVNVAQQARPQNRSNLEKLGLTAEQRAKIDAIRQRTRAEMEKILTPEQRTQLQAALKNAGPSGWIRATMNFSADQEQALRQLMQQERQQIMDVLTPEQRETIRQAMPKPRS